MRKSLLSFLGVLAAFVVPGCADGTSKSDRVITTFAPYVAADASWPDQPGGSVLAAVLEEAGMTAAPTVLTQLVEGVGTPGGSLLIATFDRPGEAQAQLVDEIQAMTISGFAPRFLGLEGQRDGYIVQVVATTPDGGPGIMFTVLVLDT